MAGIGAFARGNYAGFFGNLDYGSATPPFAATHKPAAFALNVVTRIADIRDGTSNTMAFGEILTGVNSDSDYRGVHWYDHPGCSQVYTKFPPNTPNDDVFLGMWVSPTTNSTPSSLAVGCTIFCRSWNSRHCTICRRASREAIDQSCF